MSHILFNEENIHSIKLEKNVMKSMNHINKVKPKETCLTDL